MVSSQPPFIEATTSDPFYKMIACHQADKFWSTHENSKPEGELTFSPELKDLLTRMFQVEPTHRLSMPELMSHPWMTKSTPTKSIIN